MDLREVPIVRTVLSHTSHLDGDDTGYRDVAVDPEDLGNPDPLMILPDSIVRCAVYAIGCPTSVSPYYPHGLGGSATMLLRAPAIAALLEVDKMLAGANRQIFVLDTWRSARVQAKLWAHVFSRLLLSEGKQANALSIADWIRLGRSADDTASFCRVAKNTQLDDAVQNLARQYADEFAARDTDAHACAVELLTYQANWGLVQLPLDESANTAHGSGGACDLILADKNGPTNIGVPFDSTSPAAVMDFFEHTDANRYQEIVRHDAGIRDYLAAFGIDPSQVNDDLITQIRGERRLLFHAMRAVGASYFSLAVDVGEAWHFNLGNERGGHQAHRLPYAGNACHSLLRDVRDPATNAWTATWGNSAAHAMARQILGETV